MDTINWPNGGQTFINVAKDEQSGELRVRVDDDTPYVKKHELYTATQAVELAAQHDRVAAALRNVAEHLRSQPAPVTSDDAPSAPPTLPA